ncbi:hypothetical protein ACFQZ4_50035 [Catellatospora coxensis]|uniref:Uncharacterized protein n=1 Tax=Catellatospora coxensis TaxID=310354 RepID=A0A8J3P7L6_9ACTN|nr:hypothetical protein [Catellatospora coxensis]GIG06737.1 hypothetical protein Cco03nite_34370 [Catellatospora coxensis]
MSSLSHETASRRRAAPIGAALTGWLALAGAYYFELPVFAVVSMFGWLLIAACWLWAVTASIIAVVALLGRRRRAHAAAAAVIAAAAGVAIGNADWLMIYLRSQLWIHQAELGRLAAEHRLGTLPANPELPWRLRYLSIDGHAHRQTEAAALYLPMWQNWRGEAGGGLVHLTTTPDQDTWIETAPGGQGRPLRQVGDGWWWVEGG